MADNASGPKGSGPTGSGSGQTDEKTAVAGGIALAVVLVLLILWGFFFLRKLSRGEEIPTWVPDTGSVEFEQVHDAGVQFVNDINTARDEFDRIRREATEYEAAQVERRQAEFGDLFDGSSGNSSDGFGL